MAAIMAHEVRTPLGILRSSAQLLERQPDLGDKERELSGYIVSETDRLNRLVTMLLECASPRAPDFKLHDVHDIAGNVMNLLASKAEKREVSLVREFSADDAVLACDREQLTQVFLNLVLNALQFVPNGGRVGIRTATDGDALVVQVIDDGPGIAPELRQRVFDPFFSRRDGGVGLGLTIVQQIVQVHHGDIRVTQSPWGGACFDMRFQRQQQSDE
jgi:two-component system, NtrC family, sensor histidine kinase HydH